MEELAHTLSEIFGVEIKNCYNVYMNIKHRKDDSRTYFFDELREKINKRMVGSRLWNISLHSFFDKHFQLFGYIF